MYSVSSRRLISGVRRIGTVKCISCSCCVHRRFARVHRVNSLSTLPISTISLLVRCISSNSRKRRGLRGREVPPPSPLSINTLCDANPVNPRIKEDVTMKGATIATITATTTSEAPFILQSPSSESQLLPPQVHHPNKIVNTVDCNGDVCNKDGNKSEDTSENNIERREKKVKKKTTKKKEEEITNNNTDNIINNKTHPHNDDIDNNVYTDNNNSTSFTQKEAASAAKITEHVLETDHISKKKLMRQIRKQNLLMKQHEQHNTNDNNNNNNNNNLIMKKITDVPNRSQSVNCENRSTQLEQADNMNKLGESRKLKSNIAASKKQTRDNLIHTNDDIVNHENVKNYSKEELVFKQHDNDENNCNNDKNNNIHTESSTNHDTLTYDSDTNHQSVNVKKGSGHVFPPESVHGRNTVLDKHSNNNNNINEKLEKKRKNSIRCKSERKEHHFNGEEENHKQESQLSLQEIHHIDKHERSGSNRDYNVDNANNIPTITTMETITDKMSQPHLNLVEQQMTMTMPKTTPHQFVGNEESIVTVKRNNSSRRRRSNASRMQRREIQHASRTNSHHENKCAKINHRNANNDDSLSSITLETKTADPVTHSSNIDNLIEHSTSTQINKPNDDTSEDRINAAVRAVLVQCANKSLSNADSTNDVKNNNSNNHNYSIENMESAIKTPPQSLSVQEEKNDAEKDELMKTEFSIHNNNNTELKGNNNAKFETFTVEDNNNSNISSNNNNVKGNVVELTSTPSNTTGAVNKLRKSASTRIQEHLLRKRLLLQHRERQKVAQKEAQEHQQQLSEQEKQVSCEQQCKETQLTEPQELKRSSSTEESSVQNNSRSSSSKRSGKRKLRHRTAQEVSHGLSNTNHNNNSSVNSKNKEHKTESEPQSARSTHTSSLTANPLYYPDHREAVLDIFHQLAEINNALGERYKAQSYYAACESLKKNDNLMRLLPPNLIPLPAFVSELGDAATISDNLTKRHNLISSEGVLPGVGNKLRGKIVEILRTGDLKELHSLEAKPLIRALRELTRVHGFGPRTAIAFYRYYGISTVEELKEYAAEHDTGERGTVGNKSSKDNHVQKAFKLTDAQRVGLEYYDEITQRIPYAEGRLHEAFLKIKVRKYLGKEYTLTICGSYRRKVPSSGDIDVLITRNLQTINSTTHGEQINDNKSAHSRSMNEVAPEEALAAFVTCLTNEGYILASLAQGPTKFMGICRLRRSGGDSNTTNNNNNNSPTHTFTARRIDIRFVDAASYPAAMLYFTGSKNFNVIMRSEALKKNYILNEYGLFRNPTQCNEGIASLHEMISRLAKAHYYWSTNTINPNISQTAKPTLKTSETNSEENSFNSGNTSEGADKRANNVNSNNNDKHNKNSDDKGEVNKKKRGKELTPKQLREMKELVCKVDSLRVKVHDEQDVFDALDMKYVPPQDRNM